jgi:hypothetical protein
VLQEVPGGHTPVELAIAEEVVVDAVLLPGAASARGRRDGQVEARLRLQQLLDQGALADPRWSRYDEELPAPRGAGATS